ncbi:hypothetical protein IMZ48_15000 [Candidatus Bathyarchaeota archaeon]|nr:hypothetical protein [Candidatus Bathyarchaeota archaeon]
MRNKEKFLNQEDRSASPSKRSKGKLPDIERALVSWARNARKAGRGMEVSDKEIWEQARLFAHGVDGSEHLQKLGDSWLEKFKQKQGIGQPRLARRASETNIPTSTKLSISSPLLAQGQHFNGISPASPTIQPSPLSGTRSDDDLRESMSGPYSFRSDVFKRGNNQSSTSLSSAFTEAGASSFSSSAVSPTGPFAFSPDSNVGGFLSDQRHFPPGPESNFQRPRSQTFPNLDIECLNQQGENHEPTTPKYPVSSTAPSSALESPVREADGHHHYALDSMISESPQLRHSNSNGNLAGDVKGFHMSGVVSPISSPASPSLEDARRGLELALTYAQRSASRYDEKDMMGVIRFFEGVGIRQYAKAPGSSMHPMSGLSRIPEGGEVDMGNPQGAHIKMESMMV